MLFIIVPRAGIFSHAAQSLLEPSAQQQKSRSCSEPLKNPGVVPLVVVEGMVNTATSRYRLTACPSFVPFERKLTDLAGRYCDPKNPWDIGDK